MQKFTSKSALFLTLTSATLAFFMQACGGGGNAQAQTASAPDPIEGFWQSTVTLTDCNSGAQFGAFRGVSTFNQGGTAIADNNTPAQSKGTAMGTWTKVADGTYVVKQRYWRYLEDGTPAGQQRLTRTITLAADGKSLTSKITTQALDMSDNVVQSACGAETGARIAAS